MRADLFNWDGLYQVASLIHDQKTKNVDIGMIGKVQVKMRLVRGGP